MNGSWRTLAVSLRADAGPYVAGMGQATGATKAFGNQVDKTTTTASSKWLTMSKGFAVGAGLFAVGAAMAVKTAAEFEAQIDGIAAVSGATAREIDLLRDKALQLGADTSFGASEAAEAMEALVKAGVPVSGVLNGAADAAVALAGAGGIGLAEAAEVAANAMNLFGLAAEDLPHVADLIAGAANASAIDVSDFAMSMAQSGSVAALVGADFDDLAVAITAMGQAGIKGSDAGTSLRTFLMRLEPSTDKAKTTMQDLGIIVDENTNRFFDASGELRSMAEVSDVLAGALAGQTREQKLATLNTLFGADAIRAAYVIADEGADGINRFADAIGNISAAEIEEIRLDNLSGDLERLSGAFETLLITNGSLFIDGLRTLTQGATSLVDTLAELDSAAVGQFFSSAAGSSSQLGDTWEDLYDTGANVVQILGDLIDAGRPLAELGVQLGGATIVTTLAALSEALQSTTGFLAEHSEVVAGAVVAWGTFRAAVAVGSVLPALGTFASLASAGVIQLHAALITGTVSMGTAGAAASALRARFALLTAGATGAAVGIGAVAGAAAVGYAAWKKWGDEGRKMANESVLDKLRAQLDGTAASYFNAANQAADGAVAIRRSLVGSSAPWDADWRASMSAGADEMINFGVEMVASGARIEVGMAGLRAATGLTEPALVAFAAQAGTDLPAALADGSLNIVDFTEDLIAMKAATIDGTPVTQGYAEAFATLNNETATAKERLDAVKEVIDSLIGSQISVFDATTAWGGALDSLSTSLAENALGGIDWRLEAGRNNRDAISETAQAALNLAEAFAAAGDANGAARTIAQARAEIIRAGEAAGIAEKEMSDYLDQLGLTPENIQTTIKALIDQSSLAEVEAQMDDLTRDRYITLKTSVTGAAGDLLERFLPGFEFRAAGGPVTAGRPYVVGEHRPELFVPDTSGWILPSVPTAPLGTQAPAIDYDRLAQAMAGMAGPSVTIAAGAVDARGTDVAGAATLLGRRLGWELAALG